MSIGETSLEPSSRTMGKRSGKRPGRKASKIDESAKLERSRQSARECRARKKLRYQYLEELVLHREKAVFALRDELETYKQWCTQLDTEQRVPDSLLKMIVSERISQERKQMQQANRSILQQQRQDEESQLSTSSSSTDSSPSPQHGHSPQTSHLRIVTEPQSSLHQTPSSLQQQKHQMDIEPTFQPHQISSSSQQQRHQMVIEPSLQPHQLSSSSQQQRHQMVIEPSLQPHQLSSSSQQQRHQMVIEPSLQPHQLSSSSQQQRHQMVIEPSLQPHQLSSSLQKQIHQIRVEPSLQPQSTHHQTSSSPQQQRHQIGAEQSYKRQGILHQTPSSSQQTSHRQLVVGSSFQPQITQHQTSSSSQQQRQQSGSEHQVPSQSTHHQTSSGHPRKLSPHHGQLSQTMERKTTLQRQMAFDESLLEGAISTQSEVITAKMMTAIQSHSRSFESKPTSFPQQQRVQQLLHQHHVQHQRAGSSSSASQRYNIPQHRSLQPQRTTIKNEPPLKYEHPVDRLHSLSSTELGSSSVNLVGANPSVSIEPRRARSYSNPASMMQFPRPSTHVSSTRSLPGSSLSVQASHPTPGPSGAGSSQGLGLFSGSMIGLNFPPLTLNIPASAAVEESSSSDENVNEQQLFHFSFMPQKRTSTDPAVSDNPQWSRTPRNTTFPSESTVSNTDPQVTLSNLTTVRCFSTTMTCNTPSPLSTGHSPSGLPSPTPASKYTGASGYTSSSSSSTSPAPLSSISSLLELSASSPGISTSTFSTHLDPSDLHTSGHGMSSSIPESFHCSALSLSASIDEPIPELYSFLADLEEGGMSSLTSRHGASSSHSTPLALTPKQHDQPSTPEPAYLNVPKIIDEYLDSDKEDL